MENENNTTQSEKQPLKAKTFLRIFRRKYITEFSPDNDIRFRGKISYRHLRIIGWLCLIIATIGTLMGSAASVVEGQQMFGAWPTVLEFFSNFTAPMFLIASFTVTINAKDGYRKLLILYGGLSLLFLLLFYLIYGHYVLGIAVALSPNNGRAVIDTFFRYGLGNGYLSFNIFLDLFLCALSAFFLNYTPTRFFQGRWIKLFRFFAIFPFLYVCGSVVLKITATLGIIALSPYLFPLLTTKGPMVFMIFYFMSVFIKNREKHFLRQGKTHEDYVEFQKTNVNSLHFSIRLSFNIIIGAAIDIVMLFLLTWILYSTYVPKEATVPQATSEWFFNLLGQAVFNWGIGATVSLILVIPLVIFFDYKKSYKNGLIDLLIPAGGVLLVLVTMLEGSFQVTRFTINHNREVEQAQEAATKAVRYLATRFLHR